MGVAHRLGSWAGMRAARRLSRSFPIVGTVIAVVLVGRTVRRKGWKLGLVDATLDALPFIGTAKAGVELVRGDLFPDRPAADIASRRPT
jgi:hypothetical protein